MATQKQTIAELQDKAYTLGCKVSIRKNSYGEYELRMRGRNLAPFLYAAGDFKDAVDTAQYALADVAKANDKEERDLDREYERELTIAVNTAQTMLNLVGCWIDREADTNTIVLHSPKTGNHSLNMTRGVRPVSDLLLHACGFAEQQTKPAKVEVGSIVKHKNPGWPGETGVVESIEQDTYCGQRARTRWTREDGSTHEENNAYDNLILA
jgi:hypothetical protein